MFGKQPDKPKLSIVFVLFMDGAPLWATESNKSTADVLATLKAGFQLPAGHTFDVKPASACSVADLERVRLMMELKGQLFSLQQIELAVRAGKSNLVLAGAGDVPPTPGNH